MNVDNEESTIQKADSPALTEATSYSSSPAPSPQDETDNSSVRRNLFQDPLKDTIDGPNTPANSIDRRPIVLTPNRGDHGLMDATSTTSSETTAIPSWNLSMKDATEKDVEVPLKQFVLSQSQSVPLLSSPPVHQLNRIRPILYSPSSFATEVTQLSNGSYLGLPEEAGFSHPPKASNDKEESHVGIDTVKNPSVVMEDPPKEPTSCNAALNLAPVQIAEMVYAFGQSARQRYQGTEPAKVATTQENLKTPSPKKGIESVRGNPVIVSPPPIMTSRRLSEGSSQSDRSYQSARTIERERDTLKLASKRDARTISSLQQANETQKKLNSLKEVEIVDKQAEIKKLKQHILALQKEQEGFKERETELMETIEILKNEVDKMTMLKMAPSDELEHISLESTKSPQDDPTNDATQSIESITNEQQVRIAELERLLKAKEGESFDLQTKIDWLNVQLNEKGKGDVKHESIESNKEEKADEEKVNEGLIVSEKEEIGGLLRDIVKRLEAVETEKKKNELISTISPMESCERTNFNRADEDVDSKHKDVEINISRDPDEIEATNTKNDFDSHVQTSWCCDWTLHPGE